MPKSASIPFPVMLEALKLHQIFDECNRLKPRSHQIWKDVSYTLPIKLNPETLQSYVRENRGQLMENLKKHFKLPVADISDHVNDSTEYDTSQEYLPYNVQIGEIKCPPQSYNLVLTDDDWRKICPDNKIYKDKGTDGRTYQVLRSGWTQVISKAFYLKSSLPCAFTFKYAKVFDSVEAEAYLKIHGSCKQCGATFDAHCLQKPRVNDGIILRVNTYDTSGLPHTAKRPIIGKERLEVGEQLLLRKPQQWRKEKADDMSFGDPEPPYLPNSAAIRKIKEEAINRKLGIEGNVDAIQSLDKLKSHGKYSGYIRDIGHNRFYVFYWSPMQLHLYKDLIKKFKKIEIDATGKLTLEIIPSNSEKRVTYLYQILIKGDGGRGVQPLFQMISEKHDANHITYWLREILRDGAPKPPGVDCDYSMALLNAVSLAFNDRSLATYITDCFRWLQHVELQHPLLCYIRIDIAHLIKIVCQKQVFKGKLPKVKDFFVRSVGIMSSCTDMQDFQQLLLATLIIAESEYDGMNKEGKPVVSFQKKSFMLQRMKTFVLPDNILEDSHNEHKYEHLDFDCKNEKIQSFIQHIHEEAQVQVKSLEKTEAGNDLYCPGITKHLLKFAKHFPLWTNVLSKHFPWASNVASSARCEEYFKELKHQELGPNYRPMRADKFVVKHIQSIERVSKLEKAKCSKRKLDVAEDLDFMIKPAENQRNSGNRSQDYYSDYLKYQENWLGLNPDAKRKKLEDSVNEADSSNSFNPSADSTGKEISSEIEAINNTNDKWITASVPENTKNYLAPIESYIIDENITDKTIATTKLNDTWLYDVDVNGLSSEKLLTSISDNNHTSLQQTTEEVLAANEDKENTYPNKILHTSEEKPPIPPFEELAKSEISPLKEKKLNRRGKYVRPCPDIELIYNRPLRKLKGEILLNGSKCEPIRIKGEKIYVTNTCVFDSICEVSTHSYCNYPAFKDFVDSRSDIQLFSLVIKYACEGVSMSLYLERAKILATIFEIKNSILDCWSNAATVLEKLITDAPSYTIENTHNEKCNATKTEVKLLEMDGKKQGISFEEYIKQFLMATLEKTTSKCRKCKLSHEVRTTVGPYMLIETQLFLSANKSWYPNGIKICEIPVKIEIHKKDFILSGFVRHTSGHYTSYCRSPLGTWAEHDDVRKKTKNLNNFNAIVVPEILVYIKV